MLGAPPRYSQQLEDVEGVLFTIAFELHLESEVGITVEPATLVYVLRSHRHEPVLAMAHVRAKLHDHVRELVKIGPRPKVLHRLVFE